MHVVNAHVEEGFVLNKESEQEMLDGIKSHSCRRVLLDTLLGHSCSTLLGHFFTNIFQIYFSQEFQELLSDTTLYYKACTKQLPVLLCTAKLAQGTSQHYLAWQTLHKQPPLHAF